jgi:hypothetical protein
MSPYRLKIQCTTVTAPNVEHLNGGLFGAGIAYTVTVTLTAAPGYVFPDSVQVIHGNSKTPNGDIDFPVSGSTREGIIEFPATTIPQVYFYYGDFSGSIYNLSNMDGAIDLIRAAWARTILPWSFT